MPAPSDEPEPLGVNDALAMDRNSVRVFDQKDNDDRIIGGGFEQLFSRPFVEEVEYA